MEKRALILYNVRAGRGRIYRKIDTIEAIFAEAGYVVVPKLLKFGENPFEGEDDGYDLVVVCGGDGTINYVVNAMRARGVNYTLGIIPAGTANDFAGALGMSSRVTRAARQIVSGEVQSVDCGCVNGLYFVNIFSFGMFTTTSQHTPDNLKHHIGKAAYIIEGSKELHNREYIPLTIKHDGGELEVNSMITLIFNGETAGRFPLARNASMRDGLLDCVILRRDRRIEEVWSALKYLTSGKINEDVIHLRSTRFEISSPLSPLTDVDGQPGAEFPVTVECLHNSLRVVCPKE